MRRDFLNSYVFQHINSSSYIVVIAVWFVQPWYVTSSVCVAFKFHTGAAGSNYLLH